MPNGSWRAPGRSRNKAARHNSLPPTRCNGKACIKPASRLNKLGAAAFWSMPHGTDPKVAVTAERAFEQIGIDDWRANFDLNLVGGVLLPCQEFGPAMLQQGKGSIINIASVSAHVPLSRVVAYSASKAAVLSLTQFLAREWAARGVRVNSITPGFFPAEQNRRLLFNEDGSPTARAQAILGHTPMGRFGQAHELIGAALFLPAPKPAASSREPTCAWMAVSWRKRFNLLRAYACCFTDCAGRPMPCSSAS